MGRQNRTFVQQWDKIIMSKQGLQGRVQRKTSYEISDLEAVFTPRNL
jgi:hypothetical protein